MKLALRLGRTLGELQQSMSLSELRLWVEFDKLSPIGDERGDYHAAQIVAAAHNAQGGKVELADALVKWSKEVEEEKEEEEEDWTEMEARFKQLAQ